MDNQQIEKLYRDGFPKIRSYVLKNSGTKEDAKTALHDALIAILKRGKGLAPIKNVDAYVFTAAKRAFILNFKKKSNVLGSTNDVDEQAYIPIDMQLRPDQMLEYEEKKEMIWESIKALPPRHQQMVELSVLPPPRTLREISGIMGITYKTAKAQKSLALKNLRKDLKNKGFNLK